MALDQRSVLPPEMLSVHGAHRLYTEAMDETRRLVARLTSESERLFAIESVYTSGFASNYHSHRHGQVSFIRSGFISMVTDRTTYIVPAGHAIWIPPGEMHLAQAQEEVCMLSAYSGSDFLNGLPNRCTVFQGSDMLEPLLKRLIVQQLRRQEGPLYDALLLLLHEELAGCGQLDTAIPMPSDPRLRRVCDAILTDPSITLGKETLARLGHMSVRTMTRLLRRDLGMTFLEWVQQALILTAVARLSRGEPVANVAGDLGYASPSAFTAMFHRRVGRKPSDFHYRR